MLPKEKIHPGGNTDRDWIKACIFEGMDVVRKIQKQPVDGQMLNPRIKIINIIRVK